MDEFMDGAKNPMPTTHQFFQLLLGTIAGFVANKLVEKAYLEIWSRKGR